VLLLLLLLLFLLPPIECVPEVDDLDRVAFKTHMNTYIAVRGRDKRFGKGWVCHRSADDARLVKQCKFFITTPAWAQQARYEGVLHGKNELWKTLWVPVRVGLSFVVGGLLEAGPMAVAMWAQMAWEVLMAWMHQQMHRMHQSPSAGTALMFKGA
jgi:hypothetical protein